MSYFSVSRLMPGLMVVLFTVAACNKVRLYSDEVAAQPSLVTGNSYSVFAYGVTTYTYPSTAVVGDTIEFIGRFFLDAGKTTIQIGDTTAPLLWHADLSGSGSSAIQLVKTVVTAGMGIGANRPVSISANGYTIQGPPITIKQFNLTQQTDTSLWVDQVGTNWLPDSLAYFKANGISMVISTNTAVNGTINFCNPLGTYTLSAANPVVVPQLVHGSQLQENGTTYTIDQIAGSAISSDGNTLYVSASVVENDPDTAGNLIFRLFKMTLGNPASAATINRTIVPVNPTVNETVTAFQGGVAGLKIVAAGLQTDAKGNLYFLNGYPPAVAGVNAITGQYGFGGWYYTIVDGVLAPSGGSGNSLNNVCSLNLAGQVKSILSENGGGFNTPGYPVTTPIFQVDAAGNTLYTYNYESNYIIVDLIQYSLTLNAFVARFPGWASGYTFMSYDTSSVTGTTFAPGAFQGPAFAGNYESLLVLPNGVLVGLGYESLEGIILDNKIAYCYAGTEAGLALPVAGQTQVTGKAKWVNFANVIGTSYWPFLGGFAGLDAQGGIYYFGGGQDFVNGVTFYRLYPKK